MEQSSIARVTPLVCLGDGEESVPVSIQASMDDDITSPLCSDRKDDEGDKDDLVTRLLPGTLTPSSDQPGVSQIAVSKAGDDMGPGISVEPVLARKNVDRGEEGRQTCGFDEMDSKRNEVLRGDDDDEAGDSFGRSCVKTGLTPPSGDSGTTADTGKHTPCTSKNFTTITALQYAMPGDQAPAQVVTTRPETEPCQAERGRGVQTVNSTVQSTVLELRDEVPHSTQGLIDPLVTEAGTGPCQPQVVEECGAHKIDVSHHTTENEDDRPSSACAIPPSDAEEAGTEPCQAEGAQEEEDDKLRKKNDKYPGNDDDKDMRIRRRCHHDRKGHCDIHGGGARKLWRRISCVTTDY